MIAMGTTTRKAAMGIAILVAILMLPAAVEADNPASRAAALSAKSEALGRRIDSLLDAVSRQRYARLEEERRTVRRELDAWMDGATDLDGRSVQRLLAEAYRIAGEYGVDVERMKRIQAVARKAILRADFSSHGQTGIGTVTEFTASIKDAPVIGNVLHYYGLVDEEEARIAESMRKRVVQYKNLLQVHIKALTIRDPAGALDHMRRYAGLIGDYVTTRERQAIDADTKTMLANQNGVVEFAGAFPLVGEAMDIVALYEGEDLAGNAIDRTEFIATQLAFRGLLKLAGTTLKAAGGWISGAFKRLPEDGARLNLATAELARLSGEARQALNRKLAKALGGNAPPGGDVIGAMSRKLKQNVSPRIAALEKRFKAAVENARRDLKKWGDLEDRARYFALGRKQGEELVGDFKTVLRNGSADEVRDAMLAIQGDKHAMQALKGASEETIAAFNTGMNRLYKKVDDRTVDKIADLYFDGFARAKGINPANLSSAEIKALKRKLKDRIRIDPVTNPTTGRIKPSFDRDVTARIEVEPGVWKDIPSEVLDDAYGPSFYKIVKGTDPPKPEAARELMKEMDQVSTDALHTEAYGAGRHDLAVAMEQNKVHVFQDPDQIGQVFAYKGNHWFEKAEKAVSEARKLGDPGQASRRFSQGESHFEEGMRQLTKQFDKQIEQRVAGFNKTLAEQGKAAIRIPENLRQANRIMSAVGTTETPASAMKKLTALGMTPRDVAENMGNFVTKIHKTMSSGIGIAGESGTRLAYPAEWINRKIR